MAIATAIFGETLALQLIPIASAVDGNTNTEIQASVGTSFRANFSSPSSVNRRFITTSDGMETKYQYGYGTYTFRAKANPMMEMVSMLSLKSDEGESRNEIQIAMSAKQPETLSLISYKDGKSTTGFKNIREITGLQTFDSQKNNTYKIIWSEDAIIWYVNGKKVEQFVSHVPAGPLRLHIDTTNMSWVQVRQKSIAYVVAPSPAPIPAAPAPIVNGDPVGSPERGIKIIGNQDCVTKTNAALNLLKTKAAQDYERVQKYIGVIECVDKGSGMWAWESPPRYTVGAETLNTDTTWYAGTIAHDSYHSVQYNDYKAAHPGQSVPTLIHVKNSINTQYWTGNYENRWW